MDNNEIKTEFDITPKITIKPAIDISLKLQMKNNNIVVHINSK